MFSQHEGNVPWRELSRYTGESLARRADDISSSISHITRAGDAPTVTHKLIVDNVRGVYAPFPPQAVLGPTFRDRPVFKLLFLQ